MGLEDFFAFDEDEYRSKISGYGEADLRKEHAIVRQKCLCALTCAGVGAASVIHTGGTSLILSGVAIRRNNYNEKKSQIIEQRMMEEGWTPSELTGRDYLVGIGLGVVAGLVAPGAEHIVGHLAGTRSSHFIENSIAVSKAMHHTASFANGFMEGVKAQVSTMAHGLAGHPDQLCNINSVLDVNNPGFIGDMAGQALASIAEIDGGRQITEQAARFALHKVIESSRTFGTIIKIYKTCYRKPASKEATPGGDEAGI